MCLINLCSGKIYSPSSVVENRSAENKKTWFRELLGNKNIFKNTFYGYQKYSLLILHPCQIQTDLKYDNEKTILLNICLVLGKGDCVHSSRISVLHVE